MSRHTTNCVVEILVFLCPPAHGVTGALFVTVTFQEKNFQTLRGIATVNRGYYPSPQISTSHQFHQNSVPSHDVPVRDQKPFRVAHKRTRRTVPIKITSQPGFSSQETGIGQISGNVTFCFYTDKKANEIYYILTKFHSFLTIELIKEKLNPFWEWYIGHNFNENTLSPQGCIFLAFSSLKTQSRYSQSFEKNHLQHHLPTLFSAKRRRLKLQYWLFSNIGKWKRRVFLFKEADQPNTGSRLAPSSLSPAQIVCSNLQRALFLVGGLY